MNGTMRSRLSLLALALVAVTGVPAASAQTTPPSGRADQDRHPGGPPSTQPGGMGMQGMMGREGTMSADDMKQMMSMMREMMAMMRAQSGMMASHAEERIAALKTELKITDAQAPQWNRFAEALRGAVKSMAGMHEMMQAGETTTLPARLARLETMLSAHLTEVKALREALDPLYASFSDDQKKIADGIKMGPMGMM